MQIILLERVEKLGQMGDVVTVRNGFARNFLIPQRKALRATKGNLAEFENRRVQLEAANLKRKEEALAAVSDVEGRQITVIRQAGEGGQLYGSVNPRDVAETFSAEGVTIERHQVRLDAPLKNLGLHQVRIALHPEVDAWITVNVARSSEEAELQANPELARMRAEADALERELARVEAAEARAEAEAEMS